MQLRYKEFDEFIVVNKGFGFRTHRVSDGQFGLVEFLSEKLNMKLFVVQRLDKETSGLILFAKSKQAAHNISQLFETQQVKKTYFFLTDQFSSQQELVVEAYIDKQQNSFVIIDDHLPNSKTDFKFVKQLGKYYLWQAFPETGKPHQIRLHAQKAKIPILGDQAHGGSPFFRLALHAHKVVMTLDRSTFNLEVATPTLFLQESENVYEYFFRACLEKRRELYDIPTGESFRLVHAESDRVRADIFADHLWIYDFIEVGLTETEKKSIYAFAATEGLNPVIRQMIDRGSGVGGLEKKTLEVVNTDEAWQAQEEKINYALKINSGFSPGLFLDQRENRLWVRQNSKTKKVLNLFSYTGGFSVAAGLGSAQQITTVDVSAKFLSWSKENFELNELKFDQHEFFAQDCLLFLKGSVKRGRKWDLIICDPPTFGRTKESVWKIERDLPTLAQLMLECLEKKGQILFTCNYEKMNRDEIIKMFTQKLRGFQIERLPQMSLDYEHTDDLKNVMKGLLLTKV